MVLTAGRLPAGARDEEGEAKDQKHQLLFHGRPPVRSAVAVLTRRSTHLPAEAEPLEAELDDIDKATMSVPMRHSDLYFMWYTTWIGRALVSWKQAVISPWTLRAQLVEPSTGSG
jgi:hypothetical protein